MTAWPPGDATQPPKRWKGRGRPPTRVRRTGTHTPQSFQQLAAALPAATWQTVTWRKGTRGAMRSRFARLRVRPAHRDEQRAEPTKYWLSTLPASTSLADLVRLAKLRWRIERDYQELKNELGLDHFEGRSWRGFQHHRALCIAAYAFPAAERARISPLSLCPSSQPLDFPNVSRRGALPVRPERMSPPRSPRRTNSWPARCCNVCTVAGVDAGRGPADVFSHSSTRGPAAAGLCRGDGSSPMPAVGLQDLTPTTPCR